MQLAGIDHLHIEKKGAIDLVTQIDRDVERMFRALIARAVSRSRRARGGVRAARRPPERGGVLLGVRSGRRHDELRARPADLLLRVFARAQRPADRRGDLRSEPARALHRRARRAAPGSTARRCACRRAGDADRLAAVHRLSLHGADRQATTCSGCSATSSSRRARCGGSAARRSTWPTSPRGGSTGSGRCRLNPWDVSAGALLIEEAGGQVSTLAGGAVRLAARRGRRLERPRSTPRWSTTIRSRNRTN